MNITQIRNATVLLEIGDHRILVDPMLSSPSSLAGFRLFRGQRRKNPLTALPDDVNQLIESATAVLITHEHPDHLDKSGIEWIKSRGLKVWCSSVDAPNLRRKGLDARIITEDSCDLSVEVVPAIHGHGMIGWLMGPVAGYYLAHPNEPTVYITGDTVLTDTVKSAIERLRPQVIIAPAGTANFGIGKDLMFSEAELIELAKMASGQVVFNHLEAIDHCLMTRLRLRQIMDDAGSGQQVFIPEDGERLEFDCSSDAPPVELRTSSQSTPGIQKWLTAKFAGT
ncbi:metal-dependent hydrolase [Posidoniimonas corsicana]|uniref:Metal-dependent hydrolase n=1 Tax=Posidoniimonas corsicana TaxID=1938618 RepID=A0A5C5V2L7_9BACT|nr:MBL fold metallo-hydrolase [Posidoniimonas corsicana]TWT32179.1 metal-dependent hydrolase [Posidoniimonas corsicana]